ncbi:MAG TPA: hypothetical protein PLQ13_06955 [Candidatus Krumholzibacteria bacterium]|nr:hypothetical protein [Candidatus Krumholzibacteria bacterium]
MLVRMDASSPTLGLRLRRAYLLALGLLLLGSAGLTLHPLLGHADHGPNATCELCLHLGGNPAAPSAAPTLAVPRPVAVTLAAPVPSIRPAAAPRHRSRAPPVPAAIA